MESLTRFHFNCSTMLITADVEIDDEESVDVSTAANFIVSSGPDKIKDFKLLLVVVFFGYVCNPNLLQGP